MDRATTGKLHDNWQFRKQMDLLLARSTPRPMPGQVGWIQQVNGGSDLKQAKSKKSCRQTEPAPTLFDVPSERPRGQGV